MCQLLGMSCNVPTDACFSFSGFSARGGGTDVHADGWGIAFFEGRGCRLFHDAEPARTSVVAELVRRHPIRSDAVVAHIRKATQGRVALENCHPFRRELWGRYWAFAHNGNLEGLRPPADPHFRPVGDTDSEAAFCTLLEAMDRRFPAAAPPLRELLPLLSGLTAELRRLGPFNYLLSDGEHLFAHCTTRLSYLVRQAPFGPAQLVDDDLSVDFQACTGPEDRVAVIATHPLTRNEAWTELAPGQLVVFRRGELVATSGATPPTPA